MTTLRVLVATALAACGAHAADKSDASGIDSTRDDADGDAAADAALCPATWSDGACSPYAQSPAETTFATAAPGVSFRQLTSAGVNYLTYVDVAATGACGRVLYTGEQVMPRGHKQAYTANVDGSDAVLVGEANGAGLEGIYVTGDGELAYFAGANDDGTFDLYGVPVADPTCGATRLSHHSASGMAPDVEISTASYDAVGRRWVLGFAAAGTFYRVAADGTDLGAAALTDPNPTRTFHRLRLDPACPNLLMYRRNVPGTNQAEDTIYLADLARDPIVALALNPPGVKANHMVWSPDGSQIGYSAKTGASFAVATVADPAACTLVPQADQSFATTNIKATTHASDFCAWSPDGAMLVCDSNCLDPGAATDTVYLMSFAGDTVDVVDTERDCTGLTLESQPDAHFAADAGHLLFVTDRGGSAEVYMAALPPGLAP